MDHVTFLDASAGAAPFPEARAIVTDGPDSVGFSGLEWMVIALAERETLVSLSQPGRIAVAIHGVFSDPTNPCLADPRLEALRRIAVLGWRHGRPVDGGELLAFIAAGFTLNHYDLLVDSICAGRAKRIWRHSA